MNNILNKNIISIVFLIGIILGVSLLVNKDKLYVFEERIASKLDLLSDVSDRHHAFQHYEPIFETNKLEDSPKTEYKTDLNQKYQKKNENNVLVEKDYGPGLLNINTASEKEFAQLPGIGPKLAKEIIIYRAKNGDFKDIQDLTMVTRMTNTRLLRINKYIYAAAKHSSDYNFNKDKININQASLQELEDLPGIGKVIAKSIVLYREENGPFEAIDDLINVSKIGAKKLDKIREFIYI